MKKVAWNIFLVLVLVLMFWINWWYWTLKPEKKPERNPKANFVIIGPNQKDTVHFPVEGLYGMTVIQYDGELSNWTDSRPVQIHGIEFHDMTIGVWLAFEKTGSYLKISHIAIQLGNEMITRKLPTGFLIEVGQTYSVIIDDLEKEHLWAIVRIKVLNPQVIYLTIDSTEAGSP